ncbi:amidohydrolase family protein [Pseudomonadales bacterium]|jgi:N-acyl-D-amino-acid deacylase|nr:amidohydrolase family protein [Gammaproteobacteria bacterium]MDB2706148.1 amidohydrolase family protein [Pseudomonadales bacterium]MDC3328290.1 amidohydrolase family protein [Pseudomonadales bacterium]
MDLIIRNGTIADGSGNPLFSADIGITGNRITAIGALTESAQTEIDASGKIVSPGFIDPHTHFDAQLLWDGAAKPAIEHGVTTIVPGNCSLSLAPLKAEHRMKLVGMFNQIEEMPHKAFSEGVTWDWESFEEYMTRIKQDLSINVAPLAGHSLLRLWVMGDAAMTRTAEPDEIDNMCALLTDCIRAGAVGLSTSFVDMDERLQPVPSRWASTEELDALCAVLGETKKLLQVVHEFYDIDLTLARVDQLAELSLKHDITTTLSPLFLNADNADGVAAIMARVDEQMARGARVWPQVQTRPIDISFSLEVPSLLFMRLPTWYGLIRFGTKADVLAALNDPAQRAALTQEAAPMMSLWSALVVRRVQSAANAELIGKTLAEIANLRGNTPLDVMIDLSLEEDLDAHFLAASMGHNDVPAVGALLKQPNVMIGASDGGAHILSFSTYGDTGYLFSKFVRDSQSLSIETAIRKITAEPAEIWGIQDRGQLIPGYIADITIFDPETIDRGAEYYVQDVPGDGYRYTRDAIGVSHVLIGGAVAFEKSVGYTQARTGQIV